MDGFYSQGMSREEWIMSNQTVIDYNHKPPEIINQRSSYTPLSMNNQTPSTSNNNSKPILTSYGLSKPTKAIQDVSEKYNPFVEDNVDEDMEISDEEAQAQNTSVPKKIIKEPEQKLDFSKSQNNWEVKSGTAFYKGLILYIPPFEQLSHNYRGSPALKMLYASFEFSFKMPLKIETKSREKEPNITDATVYFRDQVICTASGVSPHVEASVRALELLSETCYTIQAKEDYFLKCKLLDGENMKTLNLKKWEALSEKYPTIVEVTKNSHIQKTFAVFLDNYTSSGEFEDIVCSNLTRQDVNHLKSVVEFFHLTMLPCSIRTKLSKKNSPCVISIHKYTSAKKLLDILIECGGENEKFRIYPPDTFKDFYKLHPSYWDPSLKTQGNKIVESKTTLDDKDLQTVIMKPYKNMIADLFEKYKSLPKTDKLEDDTQLRKAGDDFMKNTLKIDMAHSKKKAPVERMQLLLKYMEQLQEYGSRVLKTGRQDMIKIYHNAIDNVRKDLDDCRRDIEKEQKQKDSGISSVTANKSSSAHSKTRSPVQRRRTPPRRRSKSPVRRDRSGYPRNRSASPRRRVRSRSPKRIEKFRRSQSPRRRPRSRSPRRPRPISPRRLRSKSPRRPKSKSPRRPRSKSPRTLRSKSPIRPRSKSPRRRPRSPSPRHSNPSSTFNQTRENQVSLVIFKDQFRRYVDILRRFRIEIEDTPIVNRSSLRDKLTRCQEQLDKFFRDLRENPSELAEYLDEMEICREELKVQDELIRGMPGPNNLQGSTIPSQWQSNYNFNNPPLPTTYPLPDPRIRYSGYSPPPLNAYPPNYTYPF